MDDHYFNYGRGGFRDSTLLGSVLSKVWRSFNNDAVISTAWFYLKIYISTLKNKNPYAVQFFFLFLKTKL
jgi:hypothetical protein